MRAAPALQVTVGGRGAWRWLAAALAAASAAAAASWCAVRLGNPTGSMALVGAASVLAAMIALRALSQPPQDLRFDGQCWWLGASPAVDGQDWSGDVAVVIDLGPCMLLRFDAPADETRKRCRRWLAVERRQLGPQWHALRCAVYSPRPGAPSVSRAAPVDPSSRE